MLAGFPSPLRMHPIFTTGKLLMPINHTHSCTPPYTYTHMPLPHPNTHPHCSKPSPRDQATTKNSKVESSILVLTW